MSKLWVVLAMVVAFVATVSSVSAVEIGLVGSSTFSVASYTDNWGRPATIAQVSADIGYSSGDNNDIVLTRSESFGPDGKKYGYLFAGSTVIVYTAGYGFGSAEPGVAHVDDITIAYSQKTTEILSVGWSDKREAYLVTFRENGKVHVEWLDLNSPVFREVLRMTNAKDGEQLATNRQEMGAGITKVINETTGLDFQPEDR